MGVSLIFVTFLVPFPAILSRRCKSTCDPAMPEISKITKDETGRLITELLVEMVRENVALYDPSFDDYSDAPCISNGWKRISK